MHKLSMLCPARPCTQVQACCSALQRGPRFRGAQRAATHVVHAQTAADLPGGLKKIVFAFQMVPDEMARYKQLLYFASKLEGLDEGLKTEEHKVQVRACHSAESNVSVAGLQRPSCTSCDWQAHALNWPRSGSIL